jgi:hypothetical protein
VWSCKQRKLTLVGRLDRFFSLCRAVREVRLVQPPLNVLVVVHRWSCKTPVLPQGIHLGKVRMSLLLFIPIWLSTIRISPTRKVYQRYKVSVVHALPCNSKHNLQPRAWAFWRCLWASLANPSDFDIFGTGRFDRTVSVDQKGGLGSRRYELSQVSATHTALCRCVRVGMFSAFKIPRFLGK